MLELAKSKKICAANWMLIAIFVFVSLFAWALASPISSAPDGDFHMSSIWCAQGNRLGICKIVREDDSSQVELLTPRTFSRYQNPFGYFCFTGNPSASAACIRNVDEKSVSELINSGRYVSGDPSKNIYYRAVSRFAEMDIDASSLKIRLTNILFFITSSAIVLGIARHRRSVFTTAYVVGLGPWGMFLIASIHPSSWSTVLVPQFFFLLLAMFTKQTLRRLLMALSSALLIWIFAPQVRADSKIFLIIGLLVALTHSIDFVRVLNESSNIKRALFLFVALFFGWRYIFPLVKSFLVLPGPLKISNYMASGLDRIFFGLTNQVPNTLINLFGGNVGLGAGDTPVSELVAICGIAAICSVACVAYNRIRKKDYWIIFSFALLISALILRAELSSVGTLGRYVLPLYLMLLMTVLNSISLANDGLIFTSRRNFKFLLTIISISNSVALHQTMRRYITGVDVIGWDLNRNAEWWWSVGPSPMTVWLVGSCAFFCAAWMIIQESQRPEIR